MTTDELRARVATEVMGWEVRGDDILWRMPGGYLTPLKYWNPDADPRDWWAVVEAMRAKGWRYRLVDRGDVVTAEFVTLPGRARAEHGHVGIAICRAALAALEDESNG